MASTRFSCNPNATLFINSSMFFDKQRPKNHSRNPSKTKKPQLSKLSMLTKASACSTKGTNKPYYQRQNKQKRMSKKNQMYTQKIISKYCRSYEESKSNKESSLLKQECNSVQNQKDRDKTVCRKRMQLNSSSLQRQKNTKRNSLIYKNRFSSQIKNQTKKFQHSKSRNTRNSQKGSPIRQTRQKKWKKHNRTKLYNLEQSLDFLSKQTHSNKPKLRVHSNHKRYENQLINNSSVEANFNDQIPQLFFSFDQYPPISSLSQTNKKKYSNQQQKKLYNGPLYSSAFLQKQSSIIKQAVSFQNNEQAQPLHKNYYIDHAQQYSEISFYDFHDQNDEFTQSPALKPGFNDFELTQNYKDMMRKTESILNNYQEQCSLLRKQRDKYRNKYKRLCGYLRSNGGVVNHKCHKNKRNMEY